MVIEEAEKQSIHLELVYREKLTVGLHRLEKAVNKLRHRILLSCEPLNRFCSSNLNSGISLYLIISELPRPVTIKPIHIWK